MAARHALPASYVVREAVVASGLMSYGTNLRMLMAKPASIQGEKPADLPVMRPTKFDFVLNLRTARVLGLTVAPGLLVAADEVIQ